jgi:competence protein ComEA
VHVGRLGTLALVLLLTSCGFFRRGESLPVSGPINLNTASLQELETLPGVTPSMARRILDGRPYADVDELVDRKILSHRELERVKKKVTLGETAQKKGGEQPGSGR